MHAARFHRLPVLRNLKKNTRVVEFPSMGKSSRAHFLVNFISKVAGRTEHKQKFGLDCQWYRFFFHFFQFHGHILYQMHQGSTSLSLNFFHSPMKLILGLLRCWGGWKAAVDRIKVVAMRSSWNIPVALIFLYLSEVRPLEARNQILASFVTCSTPCGLNHWSSDHGWPIEER